MTVIFSIVFASCTTTNISKDSKQFEQWTQIKQGFEQTHGYISECSTSWHCVKIDLSTVENLKFASSSKAFSVKEFAKKTDAIVAINTLPFSVGKSVSCTGIIKAQGKIISEPLQKYCALAFAQQEDGTLSCAILQNQDEDKIEQYAYVFGGFFVILKDGEKLEYQNIKRSRTACGTDDSGRYLYLFAATPSFSLTDRNGLSYEECAVILKELGCTQAMQFDGGHSTSMVINGKTVEAPLFQRKIAAALGF